MKRFLHLLFIAAMLGLAPFASAQSTQYRLATIDNGTSYASGYIAPFYTTVTAVWEQLIYSSAEIGGEGYIDTLWFHCYNAAPTSDNVTVKMGHTSMSVATSTSAWVPDADLTTVYSDMLSHGDSTGWIAIPLENSFYYNGYDNLVITMGVSRSSALTSTTSPKYYYSSGTSGVTMYKTTVSTHPGTVTGVRSTYHPNIQLSMREPVLSCGRPSARLTAITDQVASFVWPSVSGVSSYQIEYGPQGFTPGSGTQSLVADTTCSLTGLTASTQYDFYVRSVCSDGTYGGRNCVHFSTVCAPIAHSALPYSEDFNSYTSGSANPISSCWHKGTNYSTQYPYPYATYSCSGNGLYFYSTTAYYSYAALPMFADSLQLLMLTFDARRSTTTTTYSGIIKVGVMTNPTDIGTFAEVASFTLPAGTTDCSNYSVTFTGYTGGGRYIAFLNDNTGTNYFVIDNVEVDVLPDCPAPQGFAVAEMGDTAVTLTWTASSSATGYTLRYGPTFSTARTTITGTGDSVVLSGLTSNTSYTAELWITCGSDQTDSVVLNFTTACAMISSLPYTYGFEDASSTGSAGEINPCWGRHQQGTATAYPYPSSTYHHSGTYACYFYNNASSSATPIYTWLTMPLLSVDVSTLQVNFWAYKTSANYGHMTVGVMTDPNDISTFVTMADVQVANTSTWESFEVPLNSYTGTGRYIAFLAHASVLNYTYLDDITVDLLPTCPRPTNLDTVSVSTTSATLSWHENGSASSWRVSYGAYGGTMTDMVVSDTTVTLTGLTPGTEYQVSLRSLCSTTDSSTLSTARFYTRCSVITHSQLPYLETFDSYASGTTSAISPCWHKGTPSTATPYPYPLSSYHYGASGNALYFYTSATYNYCYAALPEFEDSLSTLELVFYARRITASYSGPIIVGVMTDPTDHSTLTEVDRVYLPSNTSWYEFTFHFDSYTGDDGYIAIATDTAYYNTIAIDEVMVRTWNNCAVPASLNIAAVMDNEATVAWPIDEMESGTSFYVEYGPHGFTPGTGTGVSLTDSDTSATFTGLTANTSYDVYLYSICSSGDTSNYRMNSFTTACAPIATEDLPYVEDFDSYTSGAASVTSSCWYRTNNYTTNYPYPYSTYHCGTSGNGLYFYATTAYYSLMALPLFEDSLQMLDLNFDARRSTTTATYSGIIKVGVMDNPTDKSTFTEVATITLPAGTTECSNYTVNFTGYTGTGRYMAILNDNIGTNYFVIDNVNVGLHSDCSRAASFAASNITENSLHLTWTLDSTHDAYTTWQIEYDTVGFTPGTGQFLYPSDTTDSISGLMPNTTYDFYLTAVCSGASSSPYMISATTACSAIPHDSLPYIENFDSYTSGSGHEFNNCWYRYYNGTGATNSYPYPYATYHHGTSGNGLYFYSSSTAGYYSYAVLPLFEDSVQNLVLNFWGYKTSAAYGNLQIGVMSDPHDFTTFTNVQSIQVANITTWEEFSIYFTNYTGNGRYIALVAPQGAINYITIDDVVVDALPACPQPTRLAVSNTLDGDSTVVEWDRMSSANDFSLAYYPDGSTFDSAIVIAHIDTNGYVLSGLSSGTSYTVYVRANCSEDTSVWAGPATFVSGVYEFPVSGTSSFVACGGTLYDNGGPDNNYSASCASIVTIYPKTDSLLTITGVLSTYDANDYLRIYDGPGVSSPQLAQYSGANQSVNVTSTYGPLTLQFVSNTANQSAGFALQVGCVPAPTCPSIVDAAVTPAATVAAATWSYLGTDTVVPTVQLRLSDAAGLVDTATTTSTHHFFTGLTRGHSYTLSLRTVCDSLATAWETVTFVTTNDTAGCTAPLVVVSGVTENSIELSWAPTGSETSWDVQYHTQTNPVWHTLLNMTTQRSEVFGSLLPSTNYYFRVIANCSDTTSSTEVMAQTLCSPIMALPWTENFDSWSAGSGQPLAACWSRYSTVSSTISYPYIMSSTYSASSPNCAYLYGTTTGFSGLITPEFSSPLNQLEVTFSLLKTSASYRIMVGCMEDPEDFNSFVPIDTVSPTANLTNEYFIVPLSAYTGTGTHLAFFTMPGATNIMYLDNITVDINRSCARVDSMRVDSTSSSSISLSWTGTAPNYQIEYGPVGFAPGSGTMVTVANNAVAPSTRSHYTVAGLHTAYDYDFYIRSQCAGGDYSNWSFVLAGSTNCGYIDTLPYVQDYERMTASTTAVQVPSCWTPISTFSAIYPQVRSTSAAGPATKGAYIYRMIQSKKNMPPDSVATGFSLPAFDPVNYPVSRLQVNFDLMKSTSALSLYRTGVIVGLCTNPGDINTFHAIDTFIANYNQWTSHEVYLDLATVPGQYITFRDYTDFDPTTNVIGNDSTLYNYCYIDNIVVSEVPNCAMPVYLSTNHVTSYSADISWTPRSGSTSWQLEYGPRGFYIGNGTRVTVSGTPSYTITGLSPISYYDFYVRSICSSGDTSDWAVVPGTFATMQVPATIPYSYNFEDPAEWANWSTSSNVATNWYRGIATASPGSEYSMYISADSGATVYNAMNSIVNAVAFRDIDFGATDSSFRVSVNSKTGGTISHNYDGLIMLVMDPQVMVEANGQSLCSPWGQVNALRVTMGTIHRDTVWRTYTASIDNIHGVRRVAFYWFGQSTGTADFMGHAAAVDDIFIDYEPCPRPTSPQTSTVGVDRATLTWNGPESASYIVYYRTADDAVYSTATTSTNYITLRNLDTATTYYWYVRKDCSGELSLSTSVLSFTTLYCFGQNFASTNDGSSTTVSYSYPFSMNSDYNYSQTIILRSELSSALQCDFNQLRLHYGSDSVMYAKDSVNIYLGHTSKSSFSSTTDRVPFSQLSLVYSGPLNCTHRGWNTFFFDSIFHYNGDSNLVVVFYDRSGSHDGTLRKFTYASAGTGNYRMVYKTGTVDFRPDTMLSSVTMTRSINRAAMRLVACGNSCQAPLIGYSRPSADEAHVEWMATNDTAFGYELELRPITSVDWSAAISVPFGDTSYLFTSLVPATQYYYRIRTQCSTVDYSDWVSGSFVTDSLNCFVPGQLAVSNVTNNSAHFTWDRAFEESRWELHVFNTIFDTLLTTTSRAVDVSGLLPGITYSAQVRSRCGNGAVSVSEWGDTIQFTTVTCPDVTGLAASNVSFGRVTLSWNTNPMAQSWIIEYGFQGFAQGEGTTVNATTNTYEVTGLLDDMAYDFYVKAVCGTDWTSEGWSSVTATTAEMPAGTYTVTVNINNSAWGTVTGAGTYQEGQTCTLVATPASDDYEFLNFDGTITDNPYSFTVSGNVTINANFGEVNAQSIADVQSGVTCSIFPNPTTASTTISVSGVNGLVRISVIDISGRTLASESLECSADCHKVMDVNDLAQGTYFVRISSDSVNMVRKLIVK